MNTSSHQVPKKEPRWWRWQRGQAMVEYWPTLPAAVMVSIVAAALVGPLERVFMTTANNLTGVTCEAPAGLPVANIGDHKVEVTCGSYDEVNNRTTVCFQVTSGCKPAISHWVLGLDKDTASKIVASNEPYEAWQVDPTTGAAGIKFDTGYDAECDSSTPGNDKDKPKGNNGVGNG
jgi:hypothetical protein